MSYKLAISIFEPVLVLRTNEQIFMCANFVCRIINIMLYTSSSTIYLYIVFWQLFFWGATVEQVYYHDIYLQILPTQ